METADATPVLKTDKGGSRSAARGPTVVDALPAFRSTHRAVRWIEPLLHEMLQRCPLEILQDAERAFAGGSADARAGRGETPADRLALDVLEFTMYR